MDIDSLADKLDSETLVSLRTYVDSLKKPPQTNDQDGRISKLENALAKKNKEHEEAIAMYQRVLRENAVAKALASQEWVDTDIVSTYVERGLVIDGDKLLFKASDGRVIPLEEAVATIAKSKPYLTKGGPHGSGYQKPKETSEPVKNPWSKENFNLTEQARLLKADPQLAARLKQESK